MYKMLTYHLMQISTSHSEQPLWYFKFSITKHSHLPEIQITINHKGKTLLHTSRKHFSGILRTSKFELYNPNMKSQLSEVMLKWLPLLAKMALVSICINLFTFTNTAEAVNKLKNHAKKLFIAKIESLLKKIFLHISGNRRFGKMTNKHTSTIMRA